MVKLSDNTYAGVANYISKKLKDRFTESEINVLTNNLFEEKLTIDKTERFLNPRNQVNEGALLGVIRAVNRLLLNEPIDYILGYSEFFGRRFRVNSDVLIPRPETEELCNWIIDDYKGKNKLDVLDIGTGSGCIPVTLAAELPTTTVSACDISEEALGVAKQNAAENKAEVSFYQTDILSDFPPIKSLDIIVSNPPYVLNSDKQEMEAKVLDFEPHIALFVEDNDPLLFYRKISEHAMENLKPTGRLYFEVHEHYADQVAELLSLSGFSTIEIREDAQGKERMVRALKA